MTTPGHLLSHNPAGAQLRGDGTGTPWFEAAVVNTLGSMVFCCSKEESLLESKKVAKAAVTFRGTNGFTTAQQHCV